MCPPRDPICLPRGLLGVRCGPLGLAFRRRGSRLPSRWGVGYGDISPSSDVVLDCGSLFGYREPNGGVTVFVFV